MLVFLVDLQIVTPLILPKGPTLTHPHPHTATNNVPFKQKK